MNPSGSFDKFYNTHVLPHVGKLNIKKRRADWSMMLIVICGFAFFPALAVFLSKFAGLKGQIFFWSVVIILAVSIIINIENSDSFEEGFKTKIITQIINFIHPGLTYKSGVCVNKIDYNRSGLFRSFFNSYEGGDLISGVYKNMNFKCSELHVRSNASRHGTIFRGLFFICPLNTSFSGGTYIWRNNNLQLPASLADEHFRLMPMPEIKKLDCKNGVFENFYSVYTTNIYEASSIVSSEMMKLIMNFKTQINRDVTLSFVGGICYVAIPFDKFLFESTQDNVGDKEEIKEYFFTVLLILSVINQLKLYEL